jgi:hypothetical protein
MYDNGEDKVIEFSTSTSLKVCHEYLPLKHLAKGAPSASDQVKPTPLAPISEGGSVRGLDSMSSKNGSARGLDSMSSISRLIASSFGRSGSRRAPPREPAPVVTASDNHVQALSMAAAARMNLSTLSRPLSTSVENQGGGSWGSLASEPAGPPAGPGAGAGNIFELGGESLFGDNRHNPARLLEPEQLVVDG